MQHSEDVPGTGGASGCVGARRWPRTTAEHSRDAARDRDLNLLRTNKVNMTVDAARRKNMPFTGNDFGAGANDDINTILGVGVACLTNFDDPPVFDTDIGLDDAPPIQNQGVSDHNINSAICPRDRRLAHTVADHLTAAKFHLIAIACEILLNFNNQLGISKAQPVAYRGAKGLGVGLPIHSHACSPSR